MTLRTRIASTIAATSLLLAGPALADEPEVAAEENAEATVAIAAVPASPEGPAIWKVADEDTTIYLFGTVHALPSDVEWYNEDIAAALGSADTIVTEILMDDTVAPRMVELVNSTGMMPPGQTLRSLLDEEQRASFETAMQKLGLPVAAFDAYEPWYAGMMLTMLPLYQQGYSPDAGVEKVLLQTAGKAQRAALETLEFQIGVFDQLPQESQVAFLVETAENIDDLKASLDAMVTEWLEGDAESLASMMNEGLTDGDLAEALLYGRNRSWATWIDERLEVPGTVFVAVGAGHLAGANSVQDALGQLGLEVERVR